MGGRQTHSAMEEIRLGVDALLATPAAALPAAEVTGLLAELEVQRRRLEAVDQRLLTEVVQRGLAGDYGRPGPVELLVTLLRVTPAEARGRVARAAELGPRRALTGAPLDPLLPLTAEAVRAGEISSGHVTVIAGCLDAIPPGMAPDLFPVAERLLVEAARHEHPKQLAKTALLLLARIDPDGAEPHEQELERRRGFSLAHRGDGSSVPRGQFTPELTALLQTVLDALAAPQPADDGVPDSRSPGQRRHDGLAEAMQRVLRSGTLPAAGGVPVTILARVSVADIANRTGVAVTGHGQPISIATLLIMAGDARLLPVFCTDTGGILAYGRGRRLASNGQRLALAARDGGCCFPGCDRPAGWTEVHHVRDWLDQGDTDLDNMCLLCRYHHREFAKHGWQVQMIDGMPWWRPPEWLDQERKPVRNTSHHLTDFDFGTVA